MTPIRNAKVASKVATPSMAVENAANTLAAEAEAILTALCDLLDRETEIVKNADFEAFRALQQDKFAMLTTYKSLMDTITRQSQATKSTADILKERLKDISERFQVSVDSNARAIDAGRNAIQRITDRIIKTARETVHGNRQTYNYAGKSSLNAKTPISLKVDEIL